MFRRFQRRLGRTTTTMPNGPTNRLLLALFAIFFVALGIGLIALKATRIEKSQDISLTSCQVTGYHPPLYTVCYVIADCSRGRVANCQSVKCNQLPNEPRIGICCNDAGKSCPYEVGQCQVFLYSTGPLAQNVSCPLHQDQCVTPGEWPCYIDTREHTILLTDPRFSAADVALLMVGVLMLLGGLAGLALVWVNRHRFSLEPSPVEPESINLAAIKPVAQ